MTLALDHCGIDFQCLASRNFYLKQFSSTWNKNFNIIHKGVFGRIKISNIKMKKNEIIFDKYVLHITCSNALQNKEHDSFYTGCNKKVWHKLQDIFLTLRRRNYVI